MITLCSTVTGLAATGGTGYVDLAWTPGDATAVSYDIYRGTHSGGEGSVYYDTSDGPYYEDDNVTDGMRYFYFVTAVNAGGAQSGDSNEAQVIPLDAPQFTSVTAASASTIDLAWNTVVGATGYLLQVSPDGYDNWTTLVNQPGTANYAQPGGDDIGVDSAGIVGYVTVQTSDNIAIV